MKKIISVIGNGIVDFNSKEYKTAYDIGQLLIENNFRVLTGGLFGVMEAASKGAREANNYVDGDIIGILPGFIPEEANAYIDIPIVTGLGIVRNSIVANSQAIISVGGGCGTLSEISMAWQLGKLILAYRNGDIWSKKLADTKLDDRIRYPDYYKDRIFGFDTPEEAIEILLDKINRYN